MEKLYLLVQRITRFLTSLIVIALLVVVVGLCAEVFCRKLFNYSLPGIHEYSGYFLAILSTVGLSQALLTKAHIRIDILYGKVSERFRWTFDILALFCLCVIAALLAIYAYPVLAKSLANQSLSNTPLATPLWIPQVIWYFGLVWFCLASVVVFLYAVTLVVQHRLDEFEQKVGATIDTGKTVEGDN